MSERKTNRNQKHQLYMSLFNTKEWHTLRARKIAECNGLCERCRREGIEKGILPDGYVTAAKTVHHLLPVEGVPDHPADTLLDRMKARCFDYNNLILVCHECHHKYHEELRSHQGQMYHIMPYQDISGNDHQQKLKAFVERMGGTYRPPIKKGIRKTRFGWMTKEEYKQKEKEDFNAWIDKLKNNGLKNTTGTASMDAATKD